MEYELSQDHLILTSESSDEGSRLNGMRHALEDFVGSQDYVLVPIGFSKNQQGEIKLTYRIESSK